jgi:Cytosol aminopeptidase family, N-terminal domain
VELRLTSPDLATVESAPGELLSFAAYTNEVPLQGIGGMVDFRLASRISRLWDGCFFGAAAGELLLLPGGIKLAFSHILVVGCGQREPLSQGVARDHYGRVMRAHRDLGLTLLALEPWLLGEEGALALADAMEEASHVAELTLIGPPNELKKLLPRVLRRRPDLKFDARDRP